MVRSVLGILFPISGFILRHMVLSSIHWSLLSIVIVMMCACACTCTCRCGSMTCDMVSIIISYRTVTAYRLECPSWLSSLLDNRSIIFSTAITSDLFEWSSWLHIRTHLSLLADWTIRFNSLILTPVTTYWLEWPWWHSICTGRTWLTSSTGSTWLTYWTRSWTSCGFISGACSFIFIFVLVSRNVLFQVMC